MPGFHTKIPGRSLLPLLGPITVVARGNFIYAWVENREVLLIYDSEGSPRVVSTETEMMEPWNDGHALLVKPIGRYIIHGMLQDRS